MISKNIENLIIRNIFFDKNKLEFENFICYNFYILIWFCFDINRFLEKNIVESLENKNHEVYFEDEYNEKIFKSLIKNFLEENSFNFFKINVEEYNNYFSTGIKNIILENFNEFKEFFQYFFSKVENFSYKFKRLAKIFFIYIFEFDQVKKFLFINFNIGYM